MLFLYFCLIINLLNSHSHKEEWKNLSCVSWSTYSTYLGCTESTKRVCVHHTAVSKLISKLLCRIKIVMDWIRNSVSEFVFDFRMPTAASSSWNISLGWNIILEFRRFKILSSFWVERLCSDLALCLSDAKELLMQSSYATDYKFLIFNSHVVTGSQRNYWQKKMSVEWDQSEIKDTIVFLFFFCRCLCVRLFIISQNFFKSSG